MIEHRLPENIAGQIYDLLVAEGVFRGDADDRKQFIYHQGRGCTEYRIGGKLGFGGKFWNSGGRLYVNAYREDETDDIRALIARVNDRLAPFQSYAGQR
jgi:hypothetical protein